MPDYGSIIQVVESVGASISIVSCIYMGIKINKEGSTNIANKMLSFLFILDFLLAIVYIIGRAAIPIHGLCQFQALLIQWFSVAAILWAVLMAYQMRQWIVEKKHPKRMEMAMQSYMRVIVATSFILAIALLGAGVYGDAYLWCWIMPRHAAVRLACFDIILFVSWGLIAYYLWEVSVSINIRLKRSSTNTRVLEMLRGNTSIQRRLMVYVAIFFIVWFFAILNRLLEWGTGKHVFATALIQVVALPLQGFWNAIAFGDTLGWLNYMGMGDQPAQNFVLNKDIRPTSELREVLVEPPKVEPGARRNTASSPTHLTLKKYAPKHYSIFSTTLNMGEAPLQSMLPDLKYWILEGHDVYAVGVQECLDLTGISQAILTHLGGPEKFSLFHTAIGSGNTSLGYHGYIALMLYVKVSEIKAGHIIPTMPAVSTMATGADLIITTAQNKGAVGLPLQIHDTSISFVTCHLPSDSKGMSKLTKRNASAHAILRGLTLAPEDAGFDLHLQHDHVMVFGDMNYRMDSQASGGGMGSLSGVAVACLIEKGVMNDDPNWHSRRYNLMRSHTDPLFPSIEEIKLLKAARASSRGAWSSVLRADELRAIMADGDAFSGFEEPMPCFPPSYKRKKGDEEGDCGDYTDPLRVIQGYTNTGEVQELDVSRLTEAQVNQAKQKIAAKKLRPPSYTDRVLVHSLPDRTDRLTVQSYDFCDRLRISDHRAVSMTVRLEVNSTVMFQNHTPVSTVATSETLIDPSKEPKFQLYELTISSLSVTLDSHTGSSTVGDASDSNESESESNSQSSDRQMSRSNDEGDELGQNSYAEFKQEQGRSVSGKEHVAEGFSTTNPLLNANKTADAYLKRARPNSKGRGVSFATEEEDKPSSAGRSVDIEMSPASSFSASPSPSPITSPGASPARGLLPSVSTAEDVAPEVVEADKASLPPRSMPAKAASSPSPRPSPGGRGAGMLTRAKSANAASLGSNVSFADSQPISTSSSSDIDATAAIPSARSRFLSRLSMRIIGNDSDGTTGRSQSPAPLLRQKSDTTISRSLVKNRNRSIFGVFTKSTSEPPEDERGDILNELARDSLSWEGDAQGAGQWRKRLQREEEERRTGRKKRSAKLVAKMKKTKKKQKNDKKVHQVVVVFPLPSKDPLLSHRKLYDFAQAYNIEGSANTGDIESNMASADGSLSKNLTREELLRPLSSFHWQEAPSRSRPSSRRMPDSPKSSGSPKSGSAKGETGSSAVSPASQNSSVVSNNGKVGSSAANSFRVTGCASPELGAHVLVKFLNASGYELGSTVLSLTHLLHTSTEEVRATQYQNITISSGGQARGTISGKFSLKFLPSLISGAAK